ncbi:MAG: hypothetical protein H7245_11460, partial [Candidatus Saccharibacteria bacterium]|nr:hypothetical protein [Pseudorhodobacter sp.]
MKVVLPLALMLFVLTVSPALAGKTLACKFNTLPTMVFHFTDAANGSPTVTIGERPDVPFEAAKKVGETNLARLDGYEFRFLPTYQTLTVTQGANVIAEETGTCVSFGGEPNGMPLKIAAKEGGVQMAASQPATIDAAPPAPAPQTTGKWQVSKETSSIDDSAGAFLALQSNEFIAGEFVGSGPAQRWLRCMEHTTAATLKMNDHCLTDIEGYGTVTYRIDDQKAAKVRMIASTDNKALGLWSGKSAIPLIKCLMRGKKVVFRIIPFNESPVEFTMDLDGPEAAITPLREA